MQATEKNKNNTRAVLTVQGWLPESGNYASERRKTATTGMAEPSLHPFRSKVHHEAETPASKWAIKEKPTQRTLRHVRRSCCGANRTGKNEPPGENCRCDVMLCNAMRSLPQARHSMCAVTELKGVNLDCRSAARVHNDAPIVVNVGELFRSTAPPAPPKHRLILQHATSTRQTGNSPKAKRT